MTYSVPVFMGSKAETVILYLEMVKGSERLRERALPKLV